MAYKNFRIVGEGIVYVTDGDRVNLNTFWISPPRMPTETYSMNIRYSAWVLAAACLDEEVEE